jgi:hypothetical protein
MTCSKIARPDSAAGSVLLSGGFVPAMLCEAEHSYVDIFMRNTPCGCMALFA